MLLLNTDPGTPYWIIGAGLFLAGCGSGTFLTGNTTQVMTALPAGSLGVVNGFRLMIMNVGIVLSVALTPERPDRLGQRRAARPGLRGHAVARSPVAVEQLMTGFQRTYAVLFAVALAGAARVALAARARPSRPSRGPA